MHRFPLLLVLLLLAACSPRSPAQDRATNPGQPPAIAREFRGAWIATVDNIDFPSRPGLPAAAMRAELDAIVARAAELHLNALVFQVRPAGDAFYQSSLEPWSEWLTGAQGKAPDGNFDPLAHIIQQCHARGIQLHAWFNPFRVWHPAGKSEPHPSHVTRKAPQLVVEHNKFQWMDPSLPAAQKWSLATVQDVLRKYDVDGVHIDDYFYPYPEGKQFADDASYAKYTKGGGKLARTAWRRMHVDTYVQKLYELVHSEKPWVQVGISPFGISRPGVPKGTSAGVDQYEQLAADVVTWMENGWLDYLAPQLYWPIDRKAQSFPVLLDYWRSQNPKRRMIWPGLGTYRMAGKEKDYRPTELRDVITLCRAGDAQPGHVHYSFKFLRNDTPNVAGALRELYREPALVPAMPWLGNKKPAAPTSKVEDGDGGKVVTWQAGEDAQFVVVQTFDGSAWRTWRIVEAKLGRCALPSGAARAVVTAVGRTGQLSR